AAAQPDISENALVNESLRQMPRIMARGLLYVCLLTVVAAAAYAVFGRIDVVVTCRAVAWPEAHKVKVHSDRSGMIDRVYIAEGAQVEKGDPLFLIRSKEAVSRRSKVEELNRAIPLKEDFYNSRMQSLVEELNHLDGEYENTLSVKQLKLEQNRLSVAGIESEIAYWQKEKANLSEEFENTRKLFEKRMTSLGEYNFFKGRLEKARSEIEKQDSQKRITMKERDILEKEIQNTRDSYAKRKAILESQIENVRLEKEAALHSLRSELEVSAKMLALRHGEAGNGRDAEAVDQVIRASCPGKVSELLFRNGGEYVKESDLLCTILPDDSPLYMDVTVPNRDIGFIEPGMRIKYKFDAFPFADYGMLEGTVSAVAPSAVEEEAGRYVYHVRGGVDKLFFEIKKKRYPVKAGMTATAELVTERKSLFALLMKKVKE
ncbi:MAG: HlyD family efflux transporter periplasmic adaptor subunit, partial [Desulfobacteraceae bacterium]|nr:HlyD family efflux transporter periplasmic adaptor subunit [Desulfobacteraceae bacterium]